MVLNSLVQKIGFKSKTDEVAYQRLVILATLFMNGILIITLMGAKLDFMGLLKIGSLFDGNYRDFEREWYNVIGSIFLVSMMIYALNPIIDLTMTQAFKKLYAAMDQGKLWGQQALPDEDNTKCRTLWEYYELYAGP